MDFKEQNAIYVQIAERICDEVLMGKYVEDERIPSVREYASIVEVNANTVMRSFDYLQSIEIIYNKRGIGYFVAPDARTRIISVRKKRFLNDDVNYFFKQAHYLGITADELAVMYNDFCIKKKNNE